MKNTIDQSVKDESGKRLKELRAEKNMSAVELAALCDITRSSISRFENGKIAMSRPTAIKISKILDTSPEYLLCESKYKNVISEIQTERSLKQLDDIISHHDDILLIQEYSKLLLLNDYEVTEYFSIDSEDYISNGNIEDETEIFQYFNKNQNKYFDEHDIENIIKSSISASHFIKVQDLKNNNVRIFFYEDFLKKISNINQLIIFLFNQKP